MNLDTGEIVNFDLEGFDDVKLDDRFDTERRKMFEDEFNKQTENKMLALTEQENKELLPLTKRVRKNKMRNKPCVCGSGVKFKKCCWGKYV